LAASACKTTGRGSGSQVLHFTTNSKRFDATFRNAPYLVAIGSSSIENCSGFMVRNAAGRLFIATASHCVGFDQDKWCVTGTFKNMIGQSGKCLRVVAADEAHDIWLFEGELTSVGHSAPPATTDALALADYDPVPGMRLRMVGFPCDPWRKCASTVTTECWVLASDLPNIKNAKDSRIDDRQASHNCSTYGGNSGGPMILAETADAIGEPGSYRSISSTPNKDGYSTAKPYVYTDVPAYLNEMSDFVRTFRSTLEREGIIISDGTNPAADPGDGSGAPGAGGAATIPSLRKPPSGSPAATNDGGTASQVLAIASGAYTDGTFICDLTNRMPASRSLTLSCGSDAAAYENCDETSCYKDGDRASPYLIKALGNRSFELHVANPNQQSNESVIALTFGPKN
jgi:hypothetical protein